VVSGVAVCHLELVADAAGRFLFRTCANCASRTQSKSGSDLSNQFNGRGLPISVTIQMGLTFDFRAGILSVRRRCRGRGRSARREGQGGKREGAGVRRQETEGQEIGVESSEVEDRRRRTAEDGLLVVSACSGVSSEIAG
jgi:hypothetical protein